MLSALDQRLRAISLSSNQMILAVTAFITLFGNFSFFGAVLKAYSVNAGNALPLLTMPVVVGAFTVLMLGILCVGRGTRPLLMLILILSSLAACFMDSYGVVIDREMLENALQTNVAEARDLLNPRLIGYLLLLGLLPALLLSRVGLRPCGWRRGLLLRLRLLALALLAIVGPVLAFGSFYTSFAREQKPLRTYANPTYYSYALVRLVEGRFVHADDGVVTPVGVDARLHPDDSHRELVILVVGETARADRFGLNGYARDTTPELRRTTAISFTDFWACGTSTAVSVPCMFSLLGQSGFDDARARKQENLLDVLKRAGVNVIWLDNNSDSKGVALRVPFENFRTPERNRMCDEECRDEGMLERVREFIAAHPKGDIFVVLHQMGNHGPAYYKRYPPAFEKFKPACQSNDLNRCSKEEIDNAYDNAILYTDHFLARVIDLLKPYDKDFETAMFYLSDHGESLGEGGTYLHGLPRAIAPKAQLHVPAIMWFGESVRDIDVAGLAADRGKRYSHDNLFHTVLGMLEIQTSIYRPELDIGHQHHRQEWR